MASKQTSFKLSKPISYLKTQQLSDEVFRFGIYLLIRDLQMLGLSPALPTTDDFTVKLKLPNRNFNQIVLNRLEKYNNDNTSDLSKIKPERLSKIILNHPENFSVSMVTPLTGDSKHMTVQVKTTDTVQLLTIISSPVTQSE